MIPNVPSPSESLALSESLGSGGLARILPTRGGSGMHFALHCLSELGKEDGKPRAVSSSADLRTEYSLFISDEGLLYPPTLCRSYGLPLSRFLLVKVTSAEEVWKVALEAVQTGLFSWILLRPSRACAPVHLRRLQLGAERARARVLVLGRARLPHWMFRVSLTVPNAAEPARRRTRGSSGGERGAHVSHSVFPKWVSSLDARVQRSLSRLVPQAVPP